MGPGGQEEEESRARGGCEGEGPGMPLWQGDTESGP